MQGYHLCREILPKRRGYIAIEWRGLCATASRRGNLRLALDRWVVDRACLFRLLPDLLLALIFAMSGHLPTLPWSSASVLRVPSASILATSASRRSILAFKRLSLRLAWPLLPLGNLCRFTATQPRPAFRQAEQGKFLSQRVLR